jgi:hypothetical protein
VSDSNQPSSNSGDDDVVLREAVQRAYGWSRHFDRWLSEGLAPVLITNDRVNISGEQLRVAIEHLKRSGS